MWLPYIATPSVDGSWVNRDMYSTYGNASGNKSCYARHRLRGAADGKRQQAVFGTGRCDQSAPSGDRTADVAIGPRQARRLRREWLRLNLEDRERSRSSTGRQAGASG